MKGNLDSCKRRLVLSGDGMEAGKKVGHGEHGSHGQIHGPIRICNHWGWSRVLPLRGVLSRLWRWCLMRYLAFALIWAAVGSAFAAPEPAPLAEKYLLSGELVKGQQELERALAASPKDDQLRFGLGVLQFVRGVE